MRLESARRLGAFLRLPAGLWVTGTHVVTGHQNARGHGDAVLPRASQGSVPRSFVKRQSEGDPVLLVQRWLSLGSRLLQPTAGSWAGLVHRHDRGVGSRVLQTLSVAPRPAGRRCPWRLRT